MNQLSRPGHPGQNVALTATGVAGAKEATIVIGSQTVKATSLRHTSEKGKEEIILPIPVNATEGCWVPPIHRAGLESRFSPGRK
jgi:hypothetical protein